MVEDVAPAIPLGTPTHVTIELRDLAVPLASFQPTRVTENESDGTAEFMVTLDQAPVP